MGKPKEAVIPTVLVAALLAAGAAAFVATRPGPWAPGPSAALASRTLTISGHARNLWPGRTVRMPVRIGNPFGVTVVVTTIRTRVGPGTGAFGTCPATDLVVRRWVGRRRVPPHAHRRIRLRVMLRGRSPDRCQGARFPLRFSALAEGP